MEAIQDHEWNDGPTQEKLNIIYRQSVQNMFKKYGNPILAQNDKVSKLYLK